VVDGEPALLRLMLKEQAGDRSNVLVIGWEELFSKFDALGLARISHVGIFVCFGYGGRILVERPSFLWHNCVVEA
jgi:hypothetical protein